MLIGQPRIFFSMARDGLVPATFGKVHPRFRTPYVATILAGGVTALLAGLLPIGLLGELTSIGALLAFVTGSAGVWILRMRSPDVPRPFKTPLVPLVPIAAIVSCLGLMAFLPGETWIPLVIWLAVGLLIYFLYGRSHSRLAAMEPTPAPAPGD
jgi:APA family basic amino acid/polyamine antiporter